MGQPGGMVGKSLNDVSSPDHKSMILQVMREMGKTHKFIHKTDIYDIVQQKITNQDFETALNALSEDGQIYSTYDDAIYSITD